MCATLTGTTMWSATCWASGSFCSSSGPSRCPPAEAEWSGKTARYPIHSADYTPNSDLLPIQAVLSASAGQGGRCAAHLALPYVALEALERFVERFSGECAKDRALDTLFVIASRSAAAAAAAASLVW